MNDNLTIDAPIFGRCTLTRKPMSETPDRPIALGYVELEGKPDSLTVALRREASQLLKGIRDAQPAT